MPSVIGRTQFIPALLAMGLLVLLVACSSPAAPAPTAKPAAPAATAAQPAAPAPTAAQAAAPAAPAKPVLLSIASAGSGGTWYWIGSAMADVITKYSGGITASNEQTAGETENIRLVDQGKVQIGMATNDGIHYARLGELQFKEKKYENLRALQNGHLSLDTWVSLDSKYKKMSDLKGSGARLTWGPAGTGAEARSKAVLQAHGIDINKDIKVMFLSFAEAAEALKNGTLDVARMGGGIPTAAVTELTTTKDVTFVQPDRAIMDKIVKDYPYWAYTMVKAGTYKGQTEDYLSPAGGTITFTRNDLPEDVVYRVQKAILEHNEDLKKVHPDAAQWDLANATKNIDIPFHPGAIKYYQEKGVWKQ